MFMKKVAKKSKKKMTIDTLAQEMRAGFKSHDKKIEKLADSIESLAIMTQSQFERIDQRFEKIDERFDGVDGRFEGIENRLENLELGQKKIHQEILNVHDTFVKRSEFDNLAERLSRVEQKLKLKSK